MVAISMFYTEYRPQQFNDLIHEEHIVSSLTGALSKGTTAHAFFFTGSRGIGKTTTARLLAKAINCDKPIIGDELKDVDPHVYFEPCNKCESCVAIQAGRHLDLIEIDAASNRGIDNIRELRENVKLSPTTSKNKVYIIDEVHMLTTEASNALLKTLEEPPAHAYFILCTTNPEKVLPTIKSRCQQFQFLRPGVDDIIKRLRFIAADQDYDVSDEKLRRIAILAKGAFREAETMLEQLINGDDSVNSLLNEQESNYFEFMSLLLSGNQSDSIKFVHDVNARGVSIELWNEKLVEYCRSLMLDKLGITGVDDTFELNDLEKELVTNTSVSVLKDSAQRFSDALSEYKFAIVSTLPLEMAIIDIATKNINPIEKAETPKSPAAPASSVTPASSATTDASSASASSEQPVSSATPSASEPKAEVKMKAETESETKIETEPKIESEPEPKSETKATTAKVVDFPYKELIEKVKPKNHSIHVILNSCDFDSFDGKLLTIKAFYSFHKERLMSYRVREVIEVASEELSGVKVKVNCILSDKKPNAKRLTDKNIVTVNDKKDVTVDAFEEVFGEELEAS